jgi:hypothetical protein
VIEAHHSHPESEALHIPLRHAQGQFNKKFVFKHAFLTYNFCSAGINGRKKRKEKKRKKKKVFVRIISVVFCVYIKGRDSNIPQLDYGFSILTLRRLMSYIYMEHPFLMFLDHTRRRSTVGRTPLDE